MAGSAGDYGENAILDYLCSSTLQLALLLQDPLDDDSGNQEPSDDADYERKPVLAADWGAAAGGVITTVNALSFCAAASDFSTVSHWGLYDATAAAAGNLLAHGDLSTARDVTGGETVTFAAGKITITCT